MGAAGSFEASGLVCEVQSRSEEYNIPVRWNGFAGRFEIYDTDCIPPRWVDWKNPREPEWACAVLSQIPALMYTAREKVAKDVRALTDEIKALNEFLSGDKEPAKTPEQQAP